MDRSDIHQLPEADCLAVDVQACDLRDPTAVVAELQALVDEALASGVSEVTFDEIIAEARTQADAIDAT
jgi:hypothetical protein